MRNFSGLDAIEKPPGIRRDIRQHRCDRLNRLIVDPDALEFRFSMIGKLAGMYGYPLAVFDKNPFFVRRTRGPGSNQEKAE